MLLKYRDEEEYCVACREVDVGTQSTASTQGKRITDNKQEHIVGSQFNLKNIQNCKLEYCMQISMNVEHRAQSPVRKFYVDSLALYRRRIPNSVITS